MRSMSWSPNPLAMACALGALLSMTSQAAAGPVRLVKGGPAKKAARTQVVSALQQLSGDLKVCFRHATSDKVQVELSVGKAGEVEQATQKHKGAVAQCVAGVLAVQKLPPCGSYTMLVELTPPADPLVQIKEELLPHRAALQLCYDRVAAKQPALAGEVKLGFLIRPDGRIVDPEIQSSSLGSSVVESCLTDTIKRARLSERPGGKTISFSIALAFSGGAGGGDGSAVAAGSLKPSKDGPVSAGALSKVMNENKQRFSACYDDQARNNPALAGRVVLRFTIRDNGTVRNVQIKESTLGNKKVESCIVKVGESLRFPGEAGRAKTRVIYPFEFSRR